MSTRTTPTNQLDVRTLQLVLPALTGVPEEVLARHLQHSEPVHRAISEILGSTQLDRVDWPILHRLLYGDEPVSRCIVLPRARLAKTEPILEQFPRGWYFVCPSGVDLHDLHQNAGQFATKFYSPWFLNSYGNWPDCQVERIPTEAFEIFIPDPDDWLLPGSKGKNREKTIELGRAFGETLPEGWVWEEPTGEVLTLLAFYYYHRISRHPLSGPNYARCRNRFKSGSWLSGGDFDTDGFLLHSWDSDPDDDLGGLRWAVRRGKVGQKPT